MINGVKKKIVTLPTSPGCYVMKDSSGTVIYIGKAKNIKKRVSSYWRARDVKTYALAREISDIEYIVTSTEGEALILEAQLIQQYHPKYNIDLQAPGRYAFIKITDEEYPRLVIARKVDRDGTYIGPYPSAAARNEAIFSAHRIFRLCKQKKKTGKPCFRYHLGQCSGACAGVISLEEYRASIKAAEKFLRGDFFSLIEDTKLLMSEAAKKEEFEKAKLYRDRLSALQKLEEQHVSHPKTYDQDVLNGLFTDTQIRLQIFHFHRGIISGRKEYSFDPLRIQRNAPHEVFTDFIMQYYRSHDIPREIILPCLPEDEKNLICYLTTIAGHGVTITIPEKGVKKKLLDLVQNNLTASYGAKGGQLYELQRALHLSRMPERIACVDISTLGGTNTVASLVQFHNGQPLKSGYRKFMIKSFVGVNDYAAIEEVITRFGKRILAGEEIAPDLLMIDGGKGQLRSALKALTALNFSLPVIALAKRLEEVYVPVSPYPLNIPPRSPALQLLRAIRDESHRFAITYQRKKRKTYKIH